MLQAQVLHKRYQLQQQLDNNTGRQTWLAADIATSPAQLVIVKLYLNPPVLHRDIKPSNLILGDRDCAC